MTLEQQLSGTVNKTIEEEIIEHVRGRKTVIRIEDPRKKFIQYISDLVAGEETKILFDKRNILSSYEEAILWAYSLEADELIFINNSGQERRNDVIKRKIKSILNEELGIIVQLDGYHRNLEIRQGKCRISIIDINY